MADNYPGSVWQSIINYADWTQKLNISATAKKLTRLNGPQLRKAVTKHLVDAWERDEQPRLLNF